MLIRQGYAEYAQTLPEVEEIITNFDNSSDYFTHLKVKKAWA
ncbi:MAG: hypothetical protein OXR68_08010 [Alphaproteobacteria bacterium]|nr:hypothetical protein [Alphaproteobacteria bacterium]MDD9920549.1 hypothetical protein [Alphaproteobacteria bacterium]